MVKNTNNNLRNYTKRGKYHQTVAGKRYTFDTAAQLAKKAKIDISDAAEIATSGDDPIYRNLILSNGETFQFNVKDAPFLIKVETDNEVKRITNQQLLGRKPLKKGKFLIKKELPRNIELKFIAHVIVIFDISDQEDVKRHTSGVVQGKLGSEELDQQAEDIGLAYFNQIPDAQNFRYEVEYTSQYEYEEEDQGNIKMRLSEPFDISNIWKDINLNKNNDCVKVYLKEKLTRMADHTIDKLGNEDGISTNEILDFCKDHNIKMIASNIQGKTFKEFKPEKKNRSYPTLIFISFSNHLYPNNNRYLEKKKHPNLEVKIVTENEINNLFNKFINELILPAEIKFNGKFFTSFIVNDTKYICNKDYQQCLDILTKFDLEDKIYDSISLSRIFSIIEKKYNWDQSKEAGKHAKINIDSFCPSLKPKGGFNYRTKIKYPNKTISQIDKNKCYSFLLQSLDYLISYDERTCKITTNPTKIVDHYLYFVRPLTKSIFMPNNDYYTGCHAKRCQELGFRMKVVLEKETEKKPNYFKQMIADIYNNLDQKIAKDICNRGIGRFELLPKVDQINNINGIYNNDESKTLSGFKHSINENYELVFNVEKYVNNLYNRMPIAYQIKDSARLLIFDKMVELGLKQDDIIKIETDSITYYGKLPKNLNHNLDGWKESNFEKVKYNKQSHDCKYGEDKLIDDFFNQNTGILKTGYAGCGKTFDIIHNVIPDLKFMGQSYIILTPSHASLQYYKLAGFKCDVIQKYEFSNTIPDVEYIIIDEIGMCGKKAHDIIYKCHLLNKNYSVYGDFRQLLPVNETKTYDNKHYLNMVFTKQEPLKINHRNHFTSGYYDIIMNEKNKECLKTLINLHSAESWEDVETIICYRRKIVKKYNDMKLKLLNKKIDSIGVKLICINNKLHYKNIYNNFEAKIIKKEDNIITLKTLISKEEIQITKNELKYFRPAYAKTVYGVQGASLKSFYYAPEDYCFINGRTAYTIISRLKTK